MTPPLLRVRALIAALVLAGCAPNTELTLNIVASNTAALSALMLSDTQTLDSNLVAALQGNELDCWTGGKDVGLAQICVERLVQTDPDEVPATLDPTVCSDAPEAGTQDGFVSFMEGQSPTELPKNADKAWLRIVGYRDANTRLQPVLCGLTAPLSDKVGASINLYMFCQPPDPNSLGGVAFSIYCDGFASLEP